MTATMCFNYGKIISSS